MRFKLLTLLACFWCVSAAPLLAEAAPPLPMVGFQEELTGARTLQFRGGAWYLNQDKLLDRTPAIVTNNPRSYATIEVYGDALSKETVVEFFDSGPSHLQDRLALPPGSGSQLIHTIPLA